MISRNEKMNTTSNGCDMIVGLMNLPTYELSENIRIKRAFPGDKATILQFIKENFDSPTWVYEAEYAMMQEGGKCLIATENGKLLGFACFDASARGFFGPIGVAKAGRNKNIGTALLIRTLEAMREYGYAYAVIGWVSDAEMFYRKTVGAEFIHNGYPENSIYSNLISM